MKKLAKLMVLTGLFFGAMSVSTLSADRPGASVCYGQDCKPDGAKVQGSYECCSRKTRRVDSDWVCCSSGDDCS